MCPPKIIMFITRNINRINRYLISFLQNSIVFILSKILQFALFLFMMTVWTSHMIIIDLAIDIPYDLEKIWFPYMMTILTLKIMIFSYNKIHHNKTHNNNTQNINHNSFSPLVYHIIT